jgi:hypothetical protein
MSQSDILELARQGESRAIAGILNYLLRSRSIFVRTHWKDDCLQILLEANQTINQTPAVNLVRQVLTNLQSPKIERVQVYGRRLGHKSVNWYEKFSLPVVELQSQNAIVQSYPDSVSDDSEQTLKSFDLVNDIPDTEEIDSAIPIVPQEESVTNAVVIDDDLEISQKSETPIENRLEPDSFSLNLEETIDATPISNEATLELEPSALFSLETSFTEPENSEDLAEPDSFSLNLEEAIDATPISDEATLELEPSALFSLETGFIEPENSEDLAEPDSFSLNLEETIEETPISDEATLELEPSALFSLETGFIEPENSEDLAEPDSFSLNLEETIEETPISDEATLELEPSALFSLETGFIEPENSEDLAEPDSFSLNLEETIEETPISDEATLELEPSALFSLETSFIEPENSEDLAEPDSFSLNLEETIDETPISVEEILEPDSSAQLFLETRAEDLSEIEDVSELGVSSNFLQDMFFETPETVTFSESTLPDLDPAIDLDPAVLEPESELIPIQFPVSWQEETPIQTLESIQPEPLILPEDNIQPDHSVQIDLAAMSEGSNMAQKDDFFIPETSMPELPATGRPQDDRVELSSIEADDTQPDSVAEPASLLSSPQSNQIAKAELLNKPEAIALIAFAIMLLLWDTYIAIMDGVVSDEETAGKGFQAKAKTATRRKSAKTSH